MIASDGSLLLGATKNFRKKLHVLNIKFSDPTLLVLRLVEHRQQCTNDYQQLKFKGGEKNSRTEKIGEWKRRFECGEGLEQKMCTVSERAQMRLLSFSLVFLAFSS